MSDSVFLICHNGVQIYVLYTAENIGLYIRIDLFHFCDHMLDLHTLRCTFPIWPAGRTSVCKSACTLNKVQAVIVSPVFDILFPDQIKRADQFHALKMNAVKLRHHGLHLTAVEHSHQDRLNHIVKMMSQCNLVASKLFCFAVKMTAPHSCTEIAR